MNRTTNMSNDPDKGGDWVKPDLENFMKCIFRWMRAGRRTFVVYKTVVTSNWKQTPRHAAKMMAHSRMSARRLEPLALSSHLTSSLLLSTAEGYNKNKNLTTAKISFRVFILWITIWPKSYFLTHKELRSGNEPGVGVCCNTTQVFTHHLYSIIHFLFG